MKFSVVFSSRTGNTALLAEKILTMLPMSECVYHGEPNKKAMDAEFIFAGFWTDKGSCDEGMASFLKGLEKKRIFLFGTAGFGTNENYFAQILSRVQANVKESNTIAGSYMCQGKMPAAVRKRYEAMPADQEGKRRKLIKNFDRAMSHPDTQDLKGLETAIKNCM